MCIGIIITHGQTANNGNKTVTKRPLKKSIDNGKIHIRKMGHTIDGGGGVGRHEETVVEFVFGCSREVNTK